MNPRVKRLLCSIPYYIVLTTVVCLAMCVPPLLIERLFWEDELYAVSLGSGHAHAVQAFERSEFKLLVLRGTRDSTDTGEMDGECHIWTWFDIPSDATWRERLLGKPHRVSSKAYVEGWNDAMRKRVEEAGPGRVGNSDGP